MKRTWLHPHFMDRLGIWMSGACLVHCLLTPIVLLFLPALMIPAWKDSVHHVLSFVIPLIALAAFIPGFRSHRDWATLALAIPGLGLIVFASVDPLDVLALQYELLLTMAGSALLVLAHFRNHRLKLSCSCPHHHHAHDAEM